MILHRHLVQALIQALEDIFNGGFYADKVVERQLKLHPKWGSRDRRYFAECIYEIVRWWRLRSYQANLKTSPSTSDYWKIWLIHTLISEKLNESDIEKISSWDEFSHFNFKNSLKNKIPESKAILHSIPDWLYDLGEQSFGAAEWDLRLEALNQQAGVHLRVNTLKTSRDKLQKQLTEEGVSTQAFGEHCLILRERKNIFITKSFQSGFFEVQDISSQKVAPFLEAKPGERVLDACAGAGGKSLHLASCMNNKGRIVAFDIHERKLEELKKRAQRAGSSIIETKLVDTTKVVKRLEGSFDRVLIDAPCSGLGVLRRNPDTKWKLSPEKLEELLQTQAEILKLYSRCLKPKGVLVYATCSIFPQENHEQVKKFLNENPNWSFVEERNIYPTVDQPGDGFYMAKLIRNP